MGRYTADEVTLSGPPATLAIRAQAADMGGTQKSINSRNWDAITLASLVEAIAAESQLCLAGIRPGVDSLWSATTVTHTLNADGLKTQTKAETPTN